jgi:HK97 family phage prohead protease
MPTPNDGEGHDDFIERCMGDDVMKSEYDDNDQRLAVCQTQWEDSRSADGLERRILGSLDLVKIRRGGKDRPTKLTGYAALFNKETELFPGLREKIAPGAFARTLAEKADVRALVDHDPSKILGRTKAGTLKLLQNSKGLRVEIKPGDTQAGRDILESIDRGDVDQMSFGFRMVKESWEDHQDGTTTRTLEDVDLFDVSAVTFPAYADTTIAARSLELRKQGGAKPQAAQTPKLDGLKKRRAELSLQ